MGELLLLLMTKEMAATATVTAFSESRRQAIVRSYSASRSKMTRDVLRCVSGVFESGSEPILSGIKSAIEDTDRYEEGEPKPSPDAVNLISDLINQADKAGAKIPRAEVSTWYGELDVTWKLDARLLKLVAYSDGRQPLIYYQEDAGTALTRGESIRPATVSALMDRLIWLLA